MADVSAGNPPPFLPDDIAHLAAMYSLGSFYKAYRAQYQNRTRAMLIGLPLFILGPAVLCAGLITLFASSYAISDALGLRGDRNLPQLIAYGITLVIFGIAIRVMIPLAWKVNASGTIVYLFQNGIIHSRGKQPTLLHWQQIASAQMNKVSRFAPNRLVFRTVDRRTIAVHTLTDIYELARRVQQTIAQVQQVRR